MVLMPYPLLALVALATSAYSLTLTETETIFCFGDSYSADGYNPYQSITPMTSVEVETLSGGLSTPPFHPFVVVPSLTDVAPTDWVQYLAKHAHVSQQFFDLAQGGATVDNKIIKGTLPDGYIVPSFHDQVLGFEEFFINNETVQWDPEKTLFTIFFGINDIGWSIWEGEYPKIRSDFDSFPKKWPSLLRSYDASVARLYDHGARHFLFMGIPPTHRSPAVTYLGEAVENMFRNNVVFANSRLAKYVDRLGRRFEDLTATWFDTASLFNELLDEPEKFGLSVTEFPCPAYESVKDDRKAYAEECVVPLAKYFWHDVYHPSFTVHRHLAKRVSKLLSTVGAKARRQKRAKGFGKPELDYEFE